MHRLARVEVIEHIVILRTDVSKATGTLERVKVVHHRLIAKTACTESIEIENRTKAGQLDKTQMGIPPKLDGK